MVERQPSRPHRPWARRRSRNIPGSGAYAWQGAARWIFPALALAAPLSGEAAGGYLLGCLLFGSAVGLWGAQKTGALWAVMTWCIVTGVFAAILVFVEVPALPDLTLIALATAAAQALALLAIGAPASISGWRARGRVLASLSGPVALALVAFQGALAWGALGTAVAVSLDLAALPLALSALRRVSR